MPLGLRRLYGKGDLHFITFSCYRRLPLLKTEQARDVFVKELAKLREVMGLRLIGFVVMPEHVHLLISEPPQGTPSTVLQKLKLRVARRLRRREKPGCKMQLRLAFEAASEPRAFWQARFFDFNVYSERKTREKLHYMHANPVVRGLVEHPKDWVWSSWAFYYGENQGLIRMDV